MLHFFKFANAVNSSLATHFPDESSVNVIAEPGRYFNESAGTLVVNVYGKRRKTHPDDTVTDETRGFNGKTIFLVIFPAHDNEPPIKINIQHKLIS